MIVSGPNQSIEISLRSNTFTTLAVKRVCLRSLRLGFQLRRSNNQGLVTFKRASTEILRARQRFLREFCLAELPIGQIQLIMDVAVMVRRSRLLEFRDGIGKLSQMHVRGPQQAAGFSQIRLKSQRTL